MNNFSLEIYQNKLCEVMKAFIAFCDAHGLYYINLDESLSVEEVRNRLQNK